MDDLGFLYGIGRSYSCAPHALYDLADSFKESAASASPEERERLVALSRKAVGLADELLDEMNDAARQLLELKQGDEDEERAAWLAALYHGQGNDKADEA